MRHGTMAMRCANCKIEIHWTPTVIDGESYCCVGCSQGGPCSCDYSRLPREGDESALVCSRVHQFHLLEVKVNLVKK